MHLIYFDEAKHDNDYSHYHIGGVAIDESDLHSVERKVANVALHCFGDDRLTPETELHAAEIFHRKKNFKDWADFPKRLEVLGQFLPILSMPQVKLINIQINTSNLYAESNAEEVAFMFFCERANGLMRSNKSLGLLIGDRESDRISASLAQSLSSYRSVGTQFRFGSKINNLVDSVHFTHSHLSRFLQLADVYTWISQFFNRNNQSTNHRHKMFFELFKSKSVDLFPATYKHWPK